MDARALQVLLPILVILPILYFRMRRSMKAQRLKPKMLLIRPGVIILAAILIISASPPPLNDAVWFAVAALAGAGLGWYWGKLTRLHLHPEDGTIMSTNSQAGMVVLIVLILFRYGVNAGLRTQGGAMHLDLALITDISITFSAFLFSARGLEIYLRAQKLLQPPAE
jgi:hypothetical protein